MNHSDYVYRVNKLSRNKDKPATLMSRDELILLHMDLAVGMAYKFKGYNCDYDDLVSVASVGLIEAADTYATGEHHFRKVAYFKIKTELCKYVLANNGSVSLPNSKYTSSMFFGDNQPEDVYHLIIKGAKNKTKPGLSDENEYMAYNGFKSIDTRMDLEKLELALNGLDKNARAFIENKYFTDEPLTAKELGAKIGVHAKSMGHIGKRAIHKLQEIML